MDIDLFYKREIETFWTSGETVLMNLLQHSFMLLDFDRGMVLIEVKFFGHKMADRKDQYQYCP